jgi:hypothetical protein
MQRSPGHQQLHAALQDRHPLLTCANIAGDPKSSFHALNA